MGTLPRHATYRVNADGSVTMRFQNTPALIQAFKEQIPAAFRTYAARDGKAWTFRPEYAEKATTLLLRHFPDAEVEYTRKSRTNAWASNQPSGSDHFRVLHLLPSAPREVVDAAYRALAKIYHPDKGGDPPTMRRLTEAYQALGRRLSA